MSRNKGKSSNLLVKLDLPLDSISIVVADSSRKGENRHFWLHWL